MIDEIKHFTPWWGKIAAKIVLNRLPISYDFWRELNLFRHGLMDTPEYSMNVFESHVARAGLIGRLKNMTILEIGPGDSIATAVIAKAYGAKAILVDAKCFAKENIDFYIMLSESLKAYGLNPPDLYSADTLQDVLSFCDAEYLTEGLASWTEIPSDSVNFVFSQSVLECIFKEEFLPILSECRRVMLPNSIASHVVDLRDLLGDSLNNLRFSEQLWESYIFRSSGFYSNRIRYSDMLNEFNLAGFEVENTVINRWENMPMPRKKLALPFRNIPEDELRIREFEILLRAKKEKECK